MISEIDAVKTVAGLMMAAARTAPKAMGIDSLVIQTIGREEMGAVAEKMDTLGMETGMTFFNTNADHVRNSDLMVLIGVKGRLPLGANCGGCGHATCAEFVKAAPTDADYPGPNCIFKITDLGIVTGSAVKCAASHNIDNRVMYTVGVAARRLGLMEDCTIVYGIPLKVSGKDIFFAETMAH
ncbi:DUF2148 domain-containing protein [Methanocorpusculum sp. MG]|uniref:DUF2148 domain-containing protein n=1 Tax=Methanocorpusculum petauri TaxID=3002863 RepID=A0ABT4IEW8_9EURY|nr:DUF2148 domain-containing protein [Methanocorpusculum petauri]MCZ0860273.1 DUF2148 domain-containing protein [Methanocorpusculum petauri]